MELKDTNLDRKYYVVKAEDVERYLSAPRRAEFKQSLEDIEYRRQRDGRKKNEYVVYNLDSPRANEVVEIVEEQYGLRR